jgi:N-acyl homoserine lactone hydrolase
VRLYLLQLGLLPALGNTALPGYLIQTDDGKNILIDSGYPRSIHGRQDQAADELVASFPGDRVTAFNATVVRNIRNDEEDLIVNRLAALGLAPRDIGYLICTHFDIDHAGNHDLFPDAELVVQRRHYNVARHYPRFHFFGDPWDTPGLHYRFVDGDTTLVPGIELIEASGHVPGLQAVLVRLPKTGPVLLAIDAITGPAHLAPDSPEILQDMDTETKRASVRKLRALAEREGVQLMVFGHNPEQWQSLKLSPEFYE